MPKKSSSNEAAPPITTISTPARSNKSSTSLAFMAKEQEQLYKSQFLESHLQASKHGLAAFVYASRAGGILLAAKEQLGHGQFISWCESQLGIKRRTAQRYMSTRKSFEKHRDQIVEAIQTLELGPSLLQQPLESMALALPSDVLQAILAPGEKEKHEVSSYLMSIDPKFGGAAKSFLRTVDLFVSDIEVDTKDLKAEREELNSTTLMPQTEWGRSTLILSVNALFESRFIASLNSAIERGNVETCLLCAPPEALTVPAFEACPHVILNRHPSISSRAKKRSSFVLLLLSRDRRTEEFANAFDDFGPSFIRFSVSVKTKAGAE